MARDDERPTDSVIASEYCLDRKRAPREIIRLVYDQPIPGKGRTVRCCDLFGSRKRYEERRKWLLNHGCRIVLCHRYTLEVKP